MGLKSRNWEKLIPLANRPAADTSVGEEVARVQEDTGDQYAERVRARLEVWNAGTLSWDRMTQPGGVGGGGGGPATIADGADVAQGSTADASTANTVVGLLKAVKAAITGTLTVATHAVTQSGAWTTGRTWTLASGTDSVNVGNFPATQPISGAVTADTELPAAAALADTAANPTAPAVGAFGLLWNGATWDRAPGSAAAGLKVQSAQLPAALAANGGIKVEGVAGGVAQPVSGTFFQATQPVSLAVAPTTPVTGTFFQATQPVSATALPLPTGAATAALQATLKAASAIAAATDTASVVQQSPQRADASTLAVTAVSAANTTVTLTLPAAAAGLFHYITSIEIVGINPTVTAIAAAATVLTFTTTNLPGSPAWTCGTLLAAGAEKLVTRMAPTTPMKSSAAATPTTVVAPAIGTGGLVRINVTYYTAP